MTRHASRWFGVCLATALLAGCGAGSPDKTAAPAEPAPAGTSSSPTSAKEDSAAKIDLTIAGGDVQPRGKRVEVKVGQKVVFNVTSDVAEELHAHTDPGQSFAIKPGEDQEFTLSVGVPGQVEVEAERLGISIVTLVVRQ